MRLQVRQVSAQKIVQADLVDRMTTLEENVKALKLETDEIWKTIASVEQTYIEQINLKDYDVSTMFTEEQRVPRSPHEKFKKRSDRMDTEEFYVTVRLHVMLLMFRMTSRFIFSRLLEIS